MKYECSMINIRQNARICGMVVHEEVVRHIIVCKYQIFFASELQVLRYGARVTMDMGERGGLLELHH